MSLSIGIVTKNRAEILRDTLNRLSEIGIDDKVIVVDGSENERTRKVCQEYPLEYYKQKEGRRIRARNIALEKCESTYIAYIDDDTIVSEEWYESLKSTLEQENVLGATGKLEEEDISLTGVPRKIRDFLFGGKDVFGEVKSNGVINGDFFYDEKKEVDHLVGCNMAFDRKALLDVGGFNEEYDVGNAYREETEPSYKISRKGKLIYEHEASVKHLNVKEVEKRRKWMFYNPYLTKYFLHRNSVISGLSNRLSYLLNKASRHTYYFLQSISNRDKSYLYYLLGEIRSFRDFIISDRKPLEYEIS